MPQYEFENLETKEIKVFYFPLSECTKWGEIREIEGEKWKRVITQAPAGFVKDTINPCSSQQFVDRSARRKGTVGDLMEESRALSEKRKQQSDNGRDPVQDKYFDKWSERRAGRQHPADTRPKPATKLKVKNDARTNK